jgi:hypothetical protein
MIVRVYKNQEILGFFLFFMNPILITVYSMDDSVFEGISGLILTSGLSLFIA